MTMMYDKMDDCRVTLPSIRYRIYVLCALLYFNDNIPNKKMTDAKSIQNINNYSALQLVVGVDRRQYICLILVRKK